jgi:PAS domain S-box-containing protein
MLEGTYTLGRSSSMTDQRQASSPNDATGRRGVSSVRTTAAVIVVAMVATTAIKLLLVEAIGHGTPFLLYFAPILVAAILGGVAAGLLTTVASAALAVAFFMETDPVAAFAEPRFLARLGAFLFEGVALTLVGSYMGRARAIAAASSAEAQSAAAKLAVILDNVDEGITMQDEVGRLLYANEPAARSLGFTSAGDLLSAPPAAILARYQLFDEHGEPLPFEELPGRVALRTGTASERVVRFREPGADVERWSVVSASPVATGERGRVAINVFRDVTERRRVEEAARGAIDGERRRLHELILEAPAAIALQRGPDHVYELANGPFLALLGGVDPTGRPACEVAVTPAWHEVLEQVFSTGVTVRRPELAVGGRTLDVTVQATRDGGGAIDGVVTFALDVSEPVEARRRIEAARINAELANRSKDEFLAILGHELRNPLAPILTALELMDLRAHGALGDERTVIERQVKHVVRLVDDLLDISRITGGKVELRRERVEIAPVVAKALEMSSPLIEAGQHDVSVSIEDGLAVDGDATRLAQVVANILNNAAKYSERGGRIWIDARRDGESVVLSVRDSGMGIAPAMLPRVFDLFSQESQALDRAQGGLGLGLAIVKSLVTLHGGEVTALSEGAGKGSELRVRLPSAAAVAPRPEGEPARARGGAVRVERILVVDDNVDAADLLAQALELLGHQVWRAGDGPEALRIASTARPTVALLDIGLPVMDGYQLARLLRELEGLDAVKLVALTGYGQASDRERSRVAGFDAHLVKPITIEHVQAAIVALTVPPGPPQP